MLVLLAACVALAVAAGAQDGPATGSRFVCTTLPPEAARAGCPLPAMPMQGGALSPEEELRAAVLQLRETVVQQKETLGAQREAIRELTGKLARCEGLAGGKAPGRAVPGKDTMGDLPRDPGHVVEQLSRSLQTLKDRLESLEVAGRGSPGAHARRRGQRWDVRSCPRGCAGHGSPGALGRGKSCVWGAGVVFGCARELTWLAPPAFSRKGRVKPSRARTAHGRSLLSEVRAGGPGRPLLSSCKSASLPEPDTLPEAVPGDVRLPREVSCPRSPVFPFINKVPLRQSRRRPGVLTRRERGRAGPPPHPKRFGGGLVSFKDVLSANARF